MTLELGCDVYIGLLYFLFVLIYFASNRHQQCHPEKVINQHQH